MADRVPKEILSKGEIAHLWKDIKLLSEAKKSPDRTYIEKENYGDYQIIHAILPAGMIYHAHFEYLGWAILAVYMGVHLISKLKPKEHNPFMCKKCGISFGSAQEYLEHFIKVHGGKK